MWRKHRETYARARWNPPRSAVLENRQKALHHRQQWEKTYRLYLGSGAAGIVRQPREGWTRPVVERSWVIDGDTPYPITREISVPLLKVMGPRLPPQLRDALPVKPTRAGKWVGRSPYHTGPRPQTFKQHDRDFIDYVKSTGEQFTLDDLSTYMVDGAWDTNKAQFEQMVQPSPVTRYDDILRGLEARASDLVIPACAPPDTLRLQSLPINPKAYPGLISKQAGFRNKEEAYSDAAVTAGYIHEAAKSKPIVDVSPWMCGGREKRNIRFHGEELKSRLVLMPEMAPAMVAQLYSDPVTQGIGQQKAGPLYIGHSMSHRGYERFLNQFEPWLVAAGMDWKAFDATVPEDLIVSAFGVLRACYPDSEEIDNVFLYLCGGFCFKTVVLPGGWVYRVFKGIPSGHPFTSLIGSVINWLAYTTAIRETAGEIPYSLAVSGDDAHLGWNNSIRPGRIRRFARVRWNMDLEVTDVGVFNGVSFDEGTTFLGTSFAFNLPGRRTSDVRQILLCPTKKDVGIGDRAEKVTGICYTPPFNSAALNLVLGYRDWLLKLALGKLVDHPWVKQFVKKRGPVTRGVGRKMYLSLPDPYEHTARQVIYWEKKIIPKVPPAFVSSRVLSQLYTQLVSEDDWVQAALDYRGVEARSVQAYPQGLRLWCRPTDKRPEWSFSS